MECDTNHKHYSQLYIKCTLSDDCSSPLTGEKTTMDTMGQGRPGAAQRAKATQHTPRTRIISPCDQVDASTKEYAEFISR